MLRQEDSKFEATINYTVRILTLSFWGSTMILPQDLMLTRQAFYRSFSQQPKKGGNSAHKSKDSAYTCK
jgi:hypothetical protein